MNAPIKSARRRELTPPLKIEAADFEKLARLSQAANSKAPEVADYLARELERAHVVPTGSLSEAVVRMGSTVAFRDDITGRTYDVVLVFPPDADIERRRISVLTPIGAALIGLSTGQTITFHSRDGARRELTVLHVTSPLNH
jgi:regulator of nucleoside diphosphate kinase